MGYIVGEQQSLGFEGHLAGFPNVKIYLEWVSAPCSCQDSARL